MIFFLLITTFVLSQSFLGEYYSYSELLLELSAYSQRKEVSLQEIGKSVLGRPIWGLKVDKGKSSNCLVLGSLYGTGYLSTLQVMKLLELSLEMETNTNLWFVPVVNVDAYIQVELTFTSGLGLFEYRKNARYTGCDIPFASGVDLNRNFETDCFDSSQNPCDFSYQGLWPFSEPETAALKRLVEHVKFDMILGYFTDASHYIVSNSKQIPDLYTLIPYEIVHSDACGSLERFGKYHGIFSVSAYVSEETYPERVKSILKEHSDVFVRLVERLSPRFSYNCQLEIMNGNGKLRVTIRNQSLVVSKNLPVTIEASDGIKNSEITMHYEQRVENIYLEGLRNTMDLVVIEIKPLESIEIELSFSSNADLTFEIQIDDRFYSEEVKTVPDRMLGKESIYYVEPEILVLIGTLFILVIFLTAVYFTWRNKQHRESKILKIPNRPLPDNFAVD